MKLVKRKGYYKYKYSDWALPQSSSYDNLDMTITYDVDMYGTFTTALYNLFFGGSSTINASVNNATRYVKCLFKHTLKPDTYYLSFTWSKQANVSVTKMIWSIIYEDDTTQQVLDATSNTSASATFTATKRVQGLNLSLYAGAGTNQYCFYTMGPLTFRSSSKSGNIVQREIGLISATSSSYDITRDAYDGFKEDTIVKAYKT